MARSDLLLQLVQSGSRGDKNLFRKVVEAIIVEERSKQHKIFADKLQESLSLINSQGDNKHLLPSSNGKSLDINNLIYEISPIIRFEDLVINKTISKLFQELIEEQNRADLLRSYNIEPRNRLLLIGPPGNGKTSFAEAFANSLMIPLLTVRYDGIITSYLGETSTRLRNLFDYVRTQKCILFFDEFDSIGKERGDIHETGEIKRVVSSLLLQIDKLPSYVIIIAATNHPELLDKAVWRRFQVKANLPKPTKQEIQSFLLKFASKFEFSFGVNPLIISKALLGLSYSEINDFCDSVYRKYILNLPTNYSIKRITNEALLELKNSYKPQTSTNG